MPTRRRLANAIRALSMDAVQKANSGHPGMPMGMADIAQVLWADHLKHNPGNPLWFDRDRFVVSNGHGSMLLYSLLHLTGYPLTIEQIEHFRQRKHTYQRFEVFAGLELTLCNFCIVDFGSYDPTFFGLPRDSQVGFERMRFVQEAPNPTLGKDKYCPACRRRLAFLKFVAAARELHVT